VLVNLLLVLGSEKDIEAERNISAFIEDWSIIRDKQLENIYTIYQNKVPKRFNYKNLYFKIAVK
jgi:hypothetical protein